MGVQSRVQMEQLQPGNRVENTIVKTMVPGAGIEPARLAARDFESRASTNFTTRATLHTKFNYVTGHLLESANRSRRTQSSKLTGICRNS